MAQRQTPSTQLSPTAQSEARAQLLVRSFEVAQTMSTQKGSATSYRGHSSSVVHGERQLPFRQTEPPTQPSSSTQKGLGRSSTRQRP